MEHMAVFSPSDECNLAHGSAAAIRDGLECPSLVSSVAPEKLPERNGNYPPLPTSDSGSTSHRTGNILPYSDNEVGISEHRRLPAPNPVHSSNRLTEQAILSRDTHADSIPSGQSTVAPGRHEFGTVNSGDAVRVQDDRDEASFQSCNIRSSFSSSIRNDNGGSSSTHYDINTNEVVCSSLGWLAPESLSHAFHPESEDANKTNFSYTEPAFDEISLTDADAEGDTDLELDLDEEVRISDDSEGVAHAQQDETSRNLQLGVCAPPTRPDGGVIDNAGRGTPSCVSSNTDKVEQTRDTLDIAKRSAANEWSRRSSIGHAPLLPQSNLHVRDDPVFVDLDERATHSDALACVFSRDDPSKIGRNVVDGTSQTPSTSATLCPKTLSQRITHLPTIVDRQSTLLWTEPTAFADERVHRDAYLAAPSDIADSNRSSGSSSLGTGHGIVVPFNDHHVAGPSSSGMDVRYGFHLNYHHEDTSTLMTYNFNIPESETGKDGDHCGENVMRLERQDDENIMGEQTSMTGRGASEDEVHVTGHQYHQLDSSLHLSDPVIQNNANDRSARRGMKQRQSVSRVVRDESGESMAAGASKPANIQGNRKQVSPTRTNAEVGNLDFPADAMRLTARSYTASAAPSTLTSAPRLDETAQAQPASEQRSCSLRRAVVHEVPDDIARHREGPSTAEYYFSAAHARKNITRDGYGAEKRNLPQSQSENETLNQMHSDAPRYCHDASFLEVTRIGQTSAQSAGQMTFPSINDGGVGIVGNVDENSDSLQRIAHLQTDKVVHAAAGSNDEPLESQEVTVHASSGDVFYDGYGVSVGSSLWANPTTSSSSKGNANITGTNNDNGIMIVQNRYSTPNPSTSINAALPPPPFALPPVISVNDNINMGSSDSYIANSLPLNGMFTSNLEFTENAVTTTFPPLHPSWQSVYPVNGAEGIYQSRVSAFENRVCPNDPVESDSTSLPMQICGVPNVSSPAHNAAVSIAPIYALSTNMPSMPSSSGNYNPHAASFDSSLITLPSLPGPSRKRDRQPSSDEESDSGSGHWSGDNGAHDSYHLSHGAGSSNQLDTLTQGFAPKSTPFPHIDAGNEHASPSHSQTSTLSGSPSMAPAAHLAGVGSPMDATNEEPEASKGKTAKAPRKKNHACWMCHKSFDRPSTLRKHLLVHTGEKAFVCNICNRRFGVASNLNRHTRRCALRPVNASRAGGTSSSNVASDDAQATPNEKVDDDTLDTAASGSKASPTESASTKKAEKTPSRGRERKTTAASSSGSSSKRRSGGSSSSDNAQPSSSTTCENTKPSASGAPSNKPKAKRRRRAPSPSRWIPETLRNFNLTPTNKSVLVPLPPIAPHYSSAVEYEERDSFSFDENYYSGTGVSVNMNNNGVGLHASLGNLGVGPYHPNGWKGRLPGPGLVGGDVTNSYLSVMAYTGGGGRGAGMGGPGGQGTGGRGAGRGDGNGGHGSGGVANSGDGGGQRGQAFVYQFTFVAASG